MKTTKAKLVSAVAMLVVTAIMMTSASFAWFTLSTTPEVSGVEVELGVTRNLEIARATTTSDTVPEVTSSDSGIETTWGSKVTSYDGESSGINYGVHISNGAIEQIKYDSTGRTLNEFEALTTTTSGMTNGVLKFTADVTYGDETINKVVGAGYGVWLRSNQEVTSMAVTIDTSAAFMYYSDHADTTYGAITDDDDTELCKVGDMIDISVRLYTGAIPTSETGWNAEDNYYQLSETQADMGTKKMPANTQELAVIIVTIKGDYLYAKDFTEGAQMCFGGFKVTFESDQIYN